MAIELDLDHSKYNCPLHYSFVITYHTPYIIYTHRLYSESSTQNSNTLFQLRPPHFTLSLSLSSKLLAIFPLAHHRDSTREIIGPSSTKHGWPWWCISATIHGWGHLLQPHCSWESLVNETVGPTTQLHPNMGPQLHWWKFSLTTLWWNFSLPTLWLPLVFLQSS